MLSERVDQELSDQDRLIFEAIVPADHRLRRVAASIDFNSFREQLASYYHPRMGRPGDAVLLVKVIFLQYFYFLSDAQVIERGQTDLAFRWFLGLSLGEAPPNPSTLSYFRSRLGAEGAQAVMDSLTRQSQQQGLLKYRLRLKDATHVMANIAIRATLPLAAEIREKVLTAARPFAADQVAATEARVVEIRATTAGRDDTARLAPRVELLQEILTWAIPLERPDNADEMAWTKFEQARELLQKMLQDADHPQAGDRLRSAQDPDARRGKHGQFYDGYLLDVMMDPDSELITALNLLPANGHEGADAATLIRHEESVTGEDVKAISIDGAGYAGEVLRELQDPEGLALDVYVPYKESSASNQFASSEFVEDVEHQYVTCPAGQTSRYRQREESRHGTSYRFALTTCVDCPLRERCLGRVPKGPFGRTVRKSDYEAEHNAVREKVTTPEYRAVKKEHPKIERKLSELVNRHGARRARYRGLAKVLSQQIWIVIAVNAKRITKLLSGALTPSLSSATTK